MKSAILIPLLLLLLSLVIHGAQGIRFITPSNSQLFMSHKAPAEMANEDVVEEDNSVWKIKQFSGMVRKLMNTSSAATTIAKNVNDKNKEKEENLSVDSSSTAEQRRTAANESYPDILDIAGMDYSQARRKPPIHN